MRQGRLKLASGLSVNCSYDLAPEGAGTVVLFAALFNVLHEGDTATLILADTSERTISIVRRLDLESAEVRVTSPEPR